MKLIFCIIILAKELNARNKLPANFESRQRQANLLTATKNGKAAAKGLDYDRIELLSVTVVEAAASSENKRKHNSVEFTDTSSCQAARNT